MKKYVWFLIGLLILSAATAAFAQDAPPIPGRIAVIGSDYNVYTLDPQSGEQTALTDDAAVSNRGVHIYESPVWSVGGELAFFGTSANAVGVKTDILISPDGTAPAVSAATLPDLTITYASWSPQNCSDACRDLAVLLSGSSSFTVDLLHAGKGGYTVTETEMGAPFYFSWSPDGTQMLWQRDSASLDIFDTAESITTTLPQSPGAMFAPAWSPVDNRLLFAIQNGDGSDLVISSEGNLQTLAANQANPVLFAWSPDGSQIAYIDRLGPLIVLDAVSGEEVSRSPNSVVQAFFWSPDSSHIAYVTSGAPLEGSFNASAPSAIKIAAPMPQDAKSLAWSVFDVANSTVRRFGSFVPTREEFYMISFFDQFAQSHRIWSPDSRYLVYSEMTPDQGAVVSLLDTTQDIAVPLVVTEGVIGVWSFD